jgi:branched-chain amino acid transport system permease protein
MLTDTTGTLPVWWVLLEMLAAGLISGLLAIVLGIPVLRLRGIYLAIATIAFVEILRVVALNLDITGGAVGIFGIPQPFQSPLEYLWIALPLLGLSMAFMYRLEKIRVGRALVAIREDELAADSMGINPTYYKVLAFTLAAILAGMVGAVNAHFLNTWNARQGTFDASIIFLAFVLIGGSRTFWGPVVGGIVLTALPEVLRGISSFNGVPLWLGQFLKDGRLIIFGVLIVVGTIFYPKGIITPEFLGWCKRTTTKVLTKNKQGA